ncbi:Holliday junction ATP-dependent DNA helicase RuvB [Apilactobacillus kunkeei]|uniref:DNA polymerase III subunit gamma/tau n=1 Tax=Apilactobacillus kunkeei TaxID=148814 RepID=UPI001C6F9509|nr:DNA polymerase III subunit gamma/tau [Apilactobacillus kunkeei]MBX8455273.1 DNA polymerase III subunit gamma/tau [Apilactobacillus kunkeei]QYU54800.1 DNA polymerase III subunit gamma/tau [Apilactobacillus kunkeei]CAI2575287.1 Holliday junction ATP-dependent DNA helicase RuvB [Apilactobacillus kunkeei]CAI2575741.1 Holliday junction ATP-dependent DNA helicase RuvB [Apilactobacillus kunkeei]CAI2575764.1 Holliday junction ATP-dependent DNA helicase RuvB [Apilactobacillus kunkeei]
MSYQALYRVWRPQRFDDVIGQDVITTTLKNAIVTNQLSHAYLFAGPRGTGKTSAAKILAKTINCPNQKDGEPCNECEICESITNGTLNDVIEIDAASNNGVEEIRDVRDKAKYAPTQATYKVYIIDEVHMLSTGAFNALLKTLEEPPAHVIFILATTEPQKIPATIISRVQRFDFKRITANDILGRMEFILNDKKIDYDDKALKVIAKAAEGGMRDALSILDQVLSFGFDKVTYENALQVTGSVTKSLLSKYLTNVVNHDVKDALSDVRQMLESGKDAARFVEDLIKYCQDILLYQQSPEMVEESELGVIDEEFKQLTSIVDAQRVYRMIVDLNDIQNQMRYTMHPDVYLDVLTVKLSTDNQQIASPVPAQSQPDFQPASASNVDNQMVQQLKDQVARLQKQVEELTKKGVAANNVGNAASEPARRPAAKKPSGSSSNARVNLTKIYPVLDNATRQDLTNIQNIWDELLSGLDVTKRALMNVSKPVAASHDGVVVSFEYPFLFQKASTDEELQDALGNGLDRILSYVPDFVFIPAEQWPEIRKGYIVAQKNSGKDVREESENSSVENSDQNDDNNNEKQDNEPKIVKQATQLFGEDIIDVKDD